MIKQGGGSIVNIASLAGVRCLPSMPAYCASKGGLIQLALQCALEYGPKGIRSNVVAPGATRTEMLINAMKGLSEAIKKDAFEVLTESVPLRMQQLRPRLPALFHSWPATTPRLSPAPF